MLTQTTRWRLGLLAIIVALAAVWLSRDWMGNLAFQRGLKAKSEWRLDDAIGYFGWARLLQRSDHLATLELGLCRQLRGDLLESQKELDALLKKKVDDRAILSRLHNAMGANHHYFDEIDSSVVSHQQALELARAAGNRALEAEALIGLSRPLYYGKGKFNEAIANLELAKSIAREISDERSEAGALRHLGVVYWWFKGELDRPLREFYFPALELYRKTNDQRGAATVLSLIALVFNNKGDVYSFMQYQNESIEIQERIGDQAGLSHSYMSMGMVYDGIGNYRKAREFYTKSLAIANRIGFSLVQNDVRALSAGVHFNLAEYDEAIRLYDPSLSHKHKDSVQFHVTGVAYCYQLKGDYTQALSLYERALQTHRQGETPDVRLEAIALLRSAECCIGLGDWQRASEFMAQAEEILQKMETHSGGDTERALVRASLAQHEGRDEQALNYLQDALETEGQIFASARTNFLIPPHHRFYERLYSFLLDYSISNTNEKVSKSANELAFSFLENRRYRSLRNFLIRVREKRAGVTSTNERERDLTERIKKLSQNLKQNDNQAAREQLRRAYTEYEELTLKSQLEQPQYLAMSAAKPVALRELREKLPADTALVEFGFAGEKSFALVITRKSLRTVVLPVSRSALAAKTKLFRSLIFTNEVNEKDWLPVAESLRTTLIEPLEQSGALKDIKKLGFIPYAFLHDLPFAALIRRDSQKQKFLIEDYALFQTPSATFFAHKMGPNPAALAGLSSLHNPPPVIAGGADSQERVTFAMGRDDFSQENLPRLEFASAEAQTVAQTTRGVALINKQATETDLKRLAYSCDYLHLSTHGVPEREMPLFSRLLLEPTATDDGSLTVREIFELGLQTKLVVLSACETGQSYSASGTDFIEQDRIGLIEAFLHAGSNSVLATLLPISDQPTTAFMKHFYGELQKQNNMADALAATQRAMLRGEIAMPAHARNLNPLPLTHPRYWAPFILVGNPQ